MTKSNTLLSKLQSRLEDQRGERLAGQQGSQSPLQGFLDNMIVPAILDAYIKPIGKLTGEDIVDFRHKYRPLACRNRATDAVSYDSRNDGVADCKHPRRLLLSAECQIGKTGAYLALLQSLQQILQPQLAVALPDFDHPIQPTSDEPDVPDDEERSQVTVDWDRQVSTCRSCVGVNHIHHCTLASICHV